jgi:hypothetical protein
LLGQQRRVRPACGQSDYFEPTGLVSHHRQGLGPDGPGRAEDDDPGRPCHRSMPTRTITLTSV